MGAFGRCISAVRLPRILLEERVEVVGLVNLRIGVPLDYAVNHILNEHAIAVDINRHIDCLARGLHPQLVEADNLVITHRDPASCIGERANLNILNAVQAVIKRDPIRGTYRVRNDALDWRTRRAVRILRDIPQRDLRH